MERFSDFRSICGSLILPLPMRTANHYAHHQRYHIRRFYPLPIFRHTSLCTLRRSVLPEASFQRLTRCSFGSHPVPVSALTPMDVLCVFVSYPGTRFQGDPDKLRLHLNPT